MVAHAAPDVASVAVVEATFVQLPTDAEVSRSSGYEPASGSPFRLGDPGTSSRALLTGVVAALLHRYTQQARVALDVVVGDASGRAAGFAVHLDTTGDVPLSTLVARAEQLLTSAPRRELGAQARSNVAAVFLDVPADAEGSLDVRSFAKTHDLLFVFADTSNGAFVTLAYNAKLFRGTTIDRLTSGYAALLDAASRMPDLAIEDLPLLQATEIRALTVEQDSGTASYPLRPVHLLCEALAQQQPHALAARFKDEQVSYEQLEQRSNRLAHCLVARGVGVGVPVAVCLRPGLDALVSLLAIFKARGVYLPLDPTHPEAHVGRMLDEAQPRVVLTHSSLSRLTQPERFAQIAFDSDAQLLAGQPSTAPATGASLEDPAYLFYTSGTTGRPKGVLATQANLAHYVHVAQQEYRFLPTDRFCALARTTFSISLFELVSPLACGGSVRLLEREEVLSPERLCRALEQVTVVHAGPSLLGSLFRYLRATPSAPRSFPNVRHASSGGDLVPPSVMEEMKRVFDRAELHVIYGCTEISCMGTTFPIERTAKVARSFVGKPFPDVTVRVVDPRGRVVPFGVVGEICFAGKGVTHGYLSQPELTAQRFVERDGLRSYATGDMGRLHPDGNLEILGRRDFQVQLRGIRIELAGIEKMIQELGLAAQCAVVAKAVGEGDVRLVGFVVKPAVSSAAAFRGALAAQLPDYMVPQHVVELEALPLTANGKLDRNRLKDTPWQKQLGGDGGRGLPANDAERKIADVFARVLRIGEVGVEDSFFDVGGDSLLAVLALEEIERALRVRIAPEVLFEVGTTRALAAHVADAPSRGAPRPILLAGEPSRPAVFMLSGIHKYRELARCLGARYSAYGLFASHEAAPPDAADRHPSVEEIAREYIAMIRRVQPSGPYRVIGYSFAGIVAYEAAQQLSASGEEVRFLGLLDAALPEWTAGWRFRLTQLARMRSASTRDLIAFFSRRVQEVLGMMEPLFGHYSADPQVAALEKRRDAANLVAATEYMTHVRPFAGPATVIASGERLRLDPLKSASCGWDAYIPTLEIQIVDGAAHGPLMTDALYASQVAEKLLASMKRADGEGTTATARS